MVEKVCAKCGRSRLEWQGNDGNGDDKRDEHDEQDVLDEVRALQIELALIATYEGQPHYLDVLARLSDWGFHPVGFFPFFWDDAGRLVECDCLLRRWP